ncbi:hypothetical protein GCM10010954_08870 [Halobacillus andaensis]|uniref:Uncharacterized protein n=1 Tax=Halobacillus andaensis TaxID=1176239 RepID=A0A917B0H5_HALAA|nr:hypothetical protein [Halobacillus andaensis]MBP2003675.1 hypothetical protein [Halobacillus andaensis]GGF12399.1 hypothetical protein GCM10010954_08870 [Halobacillus andaensis]
MVDFSILDAVYNWFDEDLLRIFGLEAWHLLFSLVFLLMAGTMWMVKPLIEWMTAKNWLVLLSYVNCIFVGFLFLQLIDRYSYDGQATNLPAYFWSISLLAMSTYGILLVFVRSVKKMAKIIRKRSKKVA